MGELNYELVGRLVRRAAELEDCVYTVGLILTKTDEDRKGLETAQSKNRKELISTVRKLLTNYIEEVPEKEVSIALLSLIDSLPQVFDVRDGSMHAVQRIRAAEGDNVSGIEPYYFWPRTGESVELSDQVLAKAIDDTSNLAERIFQLQTIILKEIRTRIRYEGFLLTVFADTEYKVPKWIYRWTPEGSLEHIEVRVAPPPTFELLLPLSRLEDLKFRLSNLGALWKESPDLDPK